MSEELLVSVIIPTYNRSNLIRRAVESVIQQSYQNLEILVIDDASLDNTAEVIEKMRDSRIRYIRHQTNRGGSATRNTGIDAAKGEYIAFLDSDDIWFPNKIKTQVAAMKNHPDPKKVVVYTQFTYKADGQTYTVPNRGKKENESLADYLFINEGEIMTSTVLLSRELSVAIKFRPDLKKHQDWDLYLRLEQIGVNFYLINESLLFWDNEEIRTDRISKTYDHKVSLNWIQGYRDIISAQAHYGFLCKEIIPQLIETEQNQLFAVKIAISSLFMGVISVQKFLLLIRRIIIPKTLRQRWTKFRKNL